MEIQDFLTAEFLITFVGSLLAIEVLVTYTKELPLIKRIPTKYYVAIVSVIHLILINYVAGIIVPSAINTYVLVINGLVMALMLTGGYNFVINKISMKQEE